MCEDDVRCGSLSARWVVNRRAAKTWICSEVTLKVFSVWVVLLLRVPGVIGQAEEV